MLQGWRKEIDDIDQEIIRLIGKRFLIVEKIGKFKKDSGMEIIQMGRWYEVLENRKKIGKEAGLPEELIENIWNMIHDHAIQKEKMQ